MAFMKINIGNTYNVPAETYYCDTDADFDTLPSNAPMGSTAYVIETGRVFIMNSKQEWIEQGGN